MSVFCTPPGEPLTTPGEHPIWFVYSRKHLGTVGIREMKDIAITANIVQKYQKTWTHAVFLMFDRDINL